MRRSLSLAAALAAALAVPSPGRAQSAGRPAPGCDAGWSGGAQYRHCEVRVYTLPGVNPLDVDAGPNGGIRAQGWDRADVELRAIVVGYARTEADARRVVSGVRVDASGTSVRSEGPRGRGADREDNESWSVSFEIRAPRQAILTLGTLNGGIAIEGLGGAVKFDARNGGVSLVDVGGDIQGKTTNGGVTVELRGTQWDGPGLDVETTNGGVRMTLPDGYSAILETGTVNGRISIDFPIAVQGTIARRLTATLGSGGARIRAVTTNGGVTIRRR